jgi:N-carbamoylputrescine amidase
MDIFEEEWQKLVNHVKSEGSDLVLLPEMPFFSWIAHTNLVDVEVWRASIVQHDRWISRFAELTPAVVVSSRPVIKGSKRLNEAFVWDEMAEFWEQHHAINHS